MQQGVSTPAAAPTCLVIPDDVDAELERQAIDAGTTTENAGGMMLNNGKLSVSSGLGGGQTVSIWHTHPYDVTFSPFDVGGLFSYGYDWDVVRTIGQATYATALTDRSPRNLTLEQIESEIDSHLDKWMQSMSFEQALHWAVYKVTSKYDALYYYAPKDSKELRLVTSEGPSPSTGDYPDAVESTALALALTS